MPGENQEKDPEQPEQTAAGSEVEPTEALTNITTEIGIETAGVLDNANLSDVIKKIREMIDLREMSEKGASINEIDKFISNVHWEDFSPKDLVKVLKEENYHVVQQAAAKALAGKEDPEATDGLIMALKNKDNDVRSIAIRALAEREGLEITKALIKIALEDKNRNVRCVAIRALAKRKDQEATDGLIEVALGHRKELARGGDWYVQVAAIKALAGREGQDVTDALIATLGDKDPRVRQAAIEALTDIEDPKVTDALEKALEDKDTDVQWAATKALEERGKKKEPKAENLSLFG